MIKIKNLGKRFKDEWVLKDINLEVNPGEIVGLVGPNGAGKTTLLNIIAGVWLPSQGSVEIGGINATDKRSQVNQILGYIPDIPFMYPKLTGREFLEFVGSLYKVEKETMNKKISELEKALEISPWLDGLMEVFPRGVRQKIMLAAMLLHSPAVLLLDEPTANLDPKSARLVKELLQRMTKQQQRASILLSTHILEIAQNLCQRMVILDKGKVIASGTMEELRKMAKSPESNLEDIFLRLTGGEVYSELLKYLS